MKTVLKLLSLLLLVCLFIGTFYWVWEKSQPEAIIYEIVDVGIDSIENLSVATGKVLPRDEVLIKPQISGIISEVLKKAGEQVREGDIIATIKVIPEMSSLNTAESRVRVAEINLNLIKTEHLRQTLLFKKGIITREEMDKSDANYKKASEELESSKDNLDIIKNGTSTNTANHSNTQVRATIDGMILDVPIKVGNSVIQSNTFNDGTTIATIANMNDMIFIGKIDETEVGRVHQGMPVKLSVGAIENTKFDAELEYISPKGVEENGAILFEIKATARIPSSVVIRAGYSANAEIVLAKVANVLSFPESCVSFDNDSAFVYIMQDNKNTKQIFEKRYIQIGLSDGMKIQVRSGLKKGDKLRGNELVKEVIRNKDVAK